ERSEGFIDGHQLFRAKVMRSFRFGCGIGDLLFADDAVADLDRFATIRRLWIDHANIIAVIAVLHLFPFHWDAQFFFGHSLKSIGLCQRDPDAGLAFDLWKFDLIDEFELVRAFDDAWIVSSANRNRGRQEKYRDSQKPHGNQDPFCKVSSPALCATCRSLLSNCKADCRRSCEPTSR